MAANVYILGLIGICRLADLTKDERKGEGDREKEDSWLEVLALC